MYRWKQAVQNSGRSDAGGRSRGGGSISMSKRSDCRFNCRERALLPWLFLAGVLAPVVIGVYGKVSAAAQQQTAPTAPSAAPAPVFDVAAIRVRIPEPHEHNSIWSSPAD